MGVKVRLINYLFSGLTAATIAVSLKIVGMLVLSSMIALPVATALQLKMSFKKTLIFSIFISVADIMLGLVLSYHLNVAPGGFTALVSVIVLILTIGINSFLKHTRFMASPRTTKIKLYNDFMKHFSKFTVLLTTISRKFYEFII